MELTPQLLTDEIDFRIAVRGYDRNEVDDFLERVAVAVGQLQTQLAKAVARARTAEARVSELEAAGPGATTDIAADDRDRLPADEPEVVAEPVDDAGDSDVADDATSALPTAPPAAPVPVIGDDDDLNEELRRTLVLAQRTADMAIREAHDEAKAIIDRANDEARHNREEAEAAHAKAREEARARLVAEIRELETTRESMRDDAAVLERHLGTERARVRETIQVLRRLVDDPASFRTGGLPELSGVTTPAELGPGSGSIDDPVGEEVDAANEIDDSEVDAPAAVDAPADAPVDTRGTSSEPTIGRARFDRALPKRNQGGAVRVASLEPERDPEPTPEPEPEIETVEDSVDGAGHEATEVARADAGSAPGPERLGSSGPDHSTSDDLGQLFAAEGSRDWRSGGTDRGDQGPHTQPVAAARFEEESDEAFLAELRRAMDDDEPLGPQ